MKGIPRREFVFLSSGAAIGNMLVSGVEEVPAADDRQILDFTSSGLVTGKPKPLKYRAIPGFLSADQIAPHHTAHYGGALRGYSALDAKLESSSRAGTAIDPNAFGSMQRGRTSKANSVVLHEFYFDGMAAKGPDPGPRVRRAIERRFGSIDKWIADFTACAKTARGWAMLASSPVNGKLYNVVSDEHSMGVIWMAVPLVVIDVYEHAFYIDYHNRKADYVEKFIDHIDWAEVDVRYRGFPD